MPLITMWGRTTFDNHSKSGGWQEELARVAAEKLRITLVYRRLVWSIQLTYSNYSDNEDSVLCRVESFCEITSSLYVSVPLKWPVGLLPVVHQHHYVFLQSQKASLLIFHFYRTNRKVHKQVNGELYFNWLNPPPFVSRKAFTDMVNQ